MKVVSVALLLSAVSAVVVKRSVSFGNSTVDLASSSSSFDTAPSVTSSLGISSASLSFGINGTGISTVATSIASTSLTSAAIIGTSATKVAAVAGGGVTTTTKTVSYTVPFDASTVVPVIIKIGVTFTTIVHAPAYTLTAYVPVSERPSWVNQQNLAVLAPVIPSHIDTSDPVHYVPNVQTTIQYATAPQGNRPQDVSNINIGFQHPAVVIDHTDHITASYAGPNAMVLTFANAQALQYAATNWLPAGQAAVVIVAYLPGSPDFALGGNTYFTAINIVCNTRQLSCTVQGIDGGLESAIDHFDADINTGFVPVYSDTKTGSTGMGSSRPVVSTNGLPSCAFGDDFDECLDRQLGYIDFKDNLAAGLSEIAPGATSTEGTEFLLDKRSAPRGSRASRLNKRCCRFLGRVFTAIVAPARRYIVEPIKKVVQVIKNVVDELTSIDRTLQTTKSLQYPPDDYGSYVTSPFGQKSIVITQGEDLTAWCVDCGTQGSVTIAGRLAASLTQGFTQAYIGMSGSIAAEVNIGVEAKKDFKKTFNKQLAQTGVKFLEAQPFYRIGPALIVGIDVDLGLELQTTFIAGARAEINNFEARVNLVNPSSSFQRNFQPSFTKRFVANGQIKGSIDVGFPISIAFGIDILSGKFKRDIALVEKPGVHLDATVAFYASANDAPRIVTINGCKGVEYGVGLFNTVFATVGTTNYPLSTFNVPLLKSCFAIAGVEDAPMTAVPQPDPADGQGTPDDTGSTPPADSGSTPPPADSGTVPPADGAPSEDTPVARKRQVLVESSTLSPSSSIASISASANATSSSFISTSVASTTSLASSSTLLESSSILASSFSQSATASVVASDSTVETASSTASSSTVASAASIRVSSARPSSSAAAGNGTVTVGRLRDTTTFNASDTLDGYALPADLLNSGAFNGTDGLDLNNTQALVRIVNQDNALLWFSDYDGNFYLEEVANAGQSVGAVDFILDDDVIVANPREQYMFYYDDELSKLGVSRLRTNDDSLTPKTATLVAFQGFTYPDGTPAVGAVDSQQNLFYILTCDIPSRGTMLFMAKDPEAGAATLMSDAVQSSITGGKVTDCYYLDYAVVKSGGQ
ncbi:hypothetical protein BCR37DRAFT_394393 [Protomyces lactucae-debilis]|uniref:Peptidase A1 domain-containing protein n=1 Tax=Protomyces lactucae-debilis TaxID=2754530 RepID=A0A1Y2F6E7_PROLT|nr:uncharacterized protein BCR37DRAFT_394393 [Protomyces lactucae-debilis]ORY79054.1 hypothetical protein BCR37DRAFT_394393 [Protomyces lactucae-debilis]